MRPIVLALAILLLAGCATTRTSVVTPDRKPPPASASSQDGLAPEVIMKAMSLIGTPYRYGGASPDTGFDCSGLVRHVFEQVAGYALPYDAQGMSLLGRHVEADELQPGDLVFFNTLHRPYSHVGIYVGERHFIHAPSTGGVVELTDMARRYWRQHYNGARRLPL